MNNYSTVRNDYIPLEAYQNNTAPEPQQDYEVFVGEESEEQNPEQQEADIVDKFLMSNNGAEYLEEDLLNRIGRKVCDDFDIDKKSRYDWEKNYDEALKLVAMKVERKDYPWDNASNIKYPIIMQAAIQFNARSYPSILTNAGVVKGKVIGKDADSAKAKKAMRISEHMNYQLMEEMEDWEGDFDNQLFMLPLLGTVFKKTYYDPASNKNVSELINPYDLVVNYRTSGTCAPMRMTHMYDLYPNQIKEKMNTGEFLEVELIHSSVTTQAQDGNETSTDKRMHETSGTQSFDDDAPHRIYEQHRWLDLDEDGYQEPYVVTVHADTQKVLRIVRRWEYDSVKRAEDGSIIKIEPTNYFTRYIFLPSPEGAYYGVGFGYLLASGCETINTIINQQLDSATDMISGGGWIGSGLLKKGKVGGTERFEPNEWKIVNMTDDIQKQILPRPTSRPSPVLYQMLQFLVSTYERLGSVTDVLTGEQNVANVPATTTIAMIEQGTKVFNAVYKRIYNALRQEMKKLFKLNSLYLDDNYYYRVLDDDKEKFVAKSDYDMNSCDVVPVCDPNNMNDILKKVKAEAVLQLKGQSHINPIEVDKIYVEALQIPYGEKIFVEPQPPPPDPRIELEAQKIKIEAERLQFDKEKFALESQKKIADTERTKVDTEKLRAETQKILSEIQDTSGVIERLNEKVKSITDVMNRQGDLIDRLTKGANNEPTAAGVPAGGMGAMEVQPNNIGGGEGIAPDIAGRGGSVGGGQMQRPELAGQNPNEVPRQGGVLQRIKGFFG